MLGGPNQIEKRLTMVVDVSFTLQCTQCFFIIITHICDPFHGLFFVWRANGETANSMSIPAIRQGSVYLPNAFKKNAHHAMLIRIRQGNVSLALLYILNTESMGAIRQSTEWREVSVFVDCIVIQGGISLVGDDRHRWHATDRRCGGPDRPLTGIRGCTPGAAGIARPHWVVTPCGSVRIPFPVDCGVRR